MTPFPFSIAAATLHISPFILSLSHVLLKARPTVLSISLDMEHSASVANTVVGT